MKARLGLALLLLSGGAVAAESEFQGLGGSKLLETMLGLVAVLALIFVLARVLQRMQGGIGGGNGLLSVVSSLSLGTRERLLLLKAADKYILVAATSQSVSALHVFDEAPEGLPESAAASEGFASLLQSIGGGGQER